MLAMCARTASFKTVPYDTPMLDRLPAEILLEVASYLSSRADILQLSQVSSAVYDKVTPALYADVELHGVEQCDRTLGMLGRRPEVARHVRTLTVFPEDDSAGGACALDRGLRAWDNAGVVSRYVMKVAKHLDALAHFEWDGEDMLPDDRMWTELRVRCQRLRRVGATFGCFLPRPTSSLLQFTDLLGFSLTLKDGFYAHSLHLPSRGGSDANKDDLHVLGLADQGSESEPVFTRLWDMLVLRCPNLESLRIMGSPSEPSDAARMLDAHWPKLRHLALGAMVWGTNATGQENTSPSFVDFLDRHSTLESLHLLGRSSANQVDLASLSPDALPNLKEFSGSFSSLRMLVDRVHPVEIPVAAQNAPPFQIADQAAVAHPMSTQLSKTLQRICFPHAMQLRDLTPLAISRVLQGLHSLTSIKVTFAIQGEYDSNGIFRTIVASCPYLLELDITCTNRPSFFLDAFANSLRGLSRLRSLSLSLVRKPGEEPMHVGASRIALANPRLKSFSIAFIPAHSSSEASPPPLERGVFDLVSDVHGIPVCLNVALRHSNLWPWQRHIGAGRGSGAGVAEWFAAFASALGIETPLILLENSVSANALASRAGGGEGSAASLGFLNRGRSSVRRWVYDLRPTGHPDVAQKGMGELLVERSPAGEEARLMTFCLCLLLLTVWALASKAVR